MSRPTSIWWLRIGQDTCVASGCNYLNTAGFVRVPTSSVTTATLRPGTYMPEMVRGPGDFLLHTTLAKSFALGSARRLQVRADIFNVLNRKNYNNPNDEHEQRELRPDHRRRARAGVSVRGEADVLI